MAKPRFLGIYSQEETEKMLKVAESLGLEFYTDGQALYCASQKNLSDFWLAYVNEDG
jgi:hypothetical protein